jgi:hypothetical protein
MSEPTEIPSRGDRIEATVRFPHGLFRRECLVTWVRRHTLDNDRSFTVVSGRYRTKAGAWSVPVRVLQEPWTILQRGVGP